MNSILFNLTYYGGYYAIKYTNSASTYLIKKIVDTLFNYYNRKMIEDNKDEDKKEDTNTKKELNNLKKRIEELENNITKYKENIENNENNEK